MPVDRSVSGIRVSGPAEKRWRAARFPTQIPSRMTTRWPVVALRPDRRTVQFGRVRAQSPSGDRPARSDVAEDEPREGGGRRPVRALVAGYRPREGGGRRPVRALVAGLLLATAIFVGAAVVALAMGATPAPAPAPGVSGGGVPAPGTSGPGGAGNIAEALPTLPAGSVPHPAGTVPDPTGTVPDPTSTVPDPAGSVPDPFVPANQGAVDPPATVSTLAPGDPGFGWPSSAFGIAP